MLLRVRERGVASRSRRCERRRRRLRACCPPRSGARAASRGTRRGGRRRRRAGRGRRGGARRRRGCPSRRLGCTGAAVRRGPRRAARRTGRADPGPRGTGCAHHFVPAGSCRTSTSARVVTLSAVMARSTHGEQSTPAAGKRHALVARLHEERERDARRRPSRRRRRRRAASVPFVEEPAVRGERVGERGGMRVLGRQPVVDVEGATARRLREVPDELAVRVHRAEAVAPAVEVERAPAARRRRRV